MKLEQSMLIKAVEWAYERAVEGRGPFRSAHQLAREAGQKTGSPKMAAQCLIDGQVARCATSGFITGLGGFMTLPIAIPANISSVLLFQLRMILSVAIIGGFDPRSEKVKSLAFLCLTGTSAARILREAGVDVDALVKENMGERLSEQFMGRINYLVKIRLFTRTGKVGFLKLGKVVPLLGGLVGGAIDAAATRAIGKTAMQVFVGAKNA